MSQANLTRRVAGAGYPHLRGRLLALALLALAAPGAWADGAYRYDSRDRVVRTPSLYHVDRVVHFSDLGVAVDDPRDVAVTGDGAVVLDTGNSRLVWLDAEFRLARVQVEFTDGERTETLNHPQGVFVAGDGAIYVADTDNRRIVVLDASGRLLRILGEPADASFRIMSADYEYRPVKVGVNALGTVYVIVRNLFEGFMQLDEEGRFEGFVGAPRVVVSPVDLLWARIFTAEQRSRMTLSLPIDYRSIDFTSDGYLLATVAAGETYSGEPIRRLSNSGFEVPIAAGDRTPPRGDILYSLGEGPSVLVDVAGQPWGVFSALDQRRGRIFTYDGEGSLLAVMGGMGNRVGQFRLPVSIDARGNDLVVLDNARKSLVVMKPTSHGRYVFAALALEANGFHDEAVRLWEQVLAYDREFEVAYAAIGRSRLAAGDYRAAVRSFRRANDREGYSRAFAELRSEVVRRIFLPVVLSAVIVAVLFAVLVKLGFAERCRALFSRLGRTAAMTRPLPLARVSGRDLVRDLRFSLHTALHPVRGFRELKLAHSSSEVRSAHSSAVPAATVILAVLCFVYVLFREGAGFVFNTTTGGFDPARFDLVRVIPTILAPLALWCTVSWALTTILQGKGTLGQVYVAAVFSTVPVLLAMIALIPVSHALVREEAGFYHGVLSLAFVWSGFLLLTSTMMTHDYDRLFRSVLIILLILAGIGVTVFVLLVLFSVGNTIVRFAAGVWREYLFTR